MEKVKVTLVKSLIGVKPNQVVTAKSLGLVRPGDCNVLTDDAALRGKLKLVSHLVTVEAAE